jgi:hypothetical protein
MPLPPNFYDATARLHGKVVSKRIESYREASTRSTTAANSRDVTPAVPDVEEEEEADANTPGPSQIRPPVSDRSENPFLVDDESSEDELDLLRDPEARLARRLEQDGVGAPPANIRALLAHGLRSVYDLPAANDDYELCDFNGALEHAFVAVSSALAAHGTQPEPKSFREAMKRSDADMWYQAAVKEMEAHMENGTWELVQLPPGRKAIGSKWVFKVKRNPDGSVERYKARLVAKGYAQRPGVDFDETFAPTTKWAALRTILALAGVEDWELESVDISNAYLNGELNDADVYMEQPEGFADRDPSWVARLLKGLYGLKQGGRKWFERLEQVLIELGFSRIRSDASVFVWAKNGVRVIVPVFVDDITFASKDKAKIQELKLELGKHFKLRDLGATSFLLGVEITRDRAKRTLHLSQRQYVLDLLDRFGFADSSPVSTPLDPGTRLSADQAPATADDEAFMRTVPYVSAVGALMYLAIATRPDIAYSVGVLCRFMAKPGPAHWKAVKHLFRYLRGTCDYRLTYAPDISSQELFSTYSDADHGGNPDNGRSTSGFVVKIGTGAVSWMSCLQSIVTLSTTEAEFVSAVSAGQELVWMRTFLTELGFPPPGPSLMLLDNQSAIQVARNPEHHGRMKHLDLRFFWLRDMVTSGVIRVLYIPTAVMAADMLTKPLARIKVAEAVPLLGLTAP